MAFIKKKTVWKLHSWVGLICGLPLVLIGLTGSVLVFHTEITKALQPEFILVENSTPTKEARFPLQTIIKHVEKTHPDFWVRGYLPRYDSELRDIAFMKRHGEDNEWYVLTVDPYNLNTSTQPRDFESTIYGWFVELHYTFFSEGIGVAIAGIMALGFIFLGVSGFYLYRDFWKHFFRLRWKKNARIFLSDFHKMIGITALPINMVLGITGAYWNITHTIHDIEHVIEGEDHDPLELPYPGAIEHLPTLVKNAHDLWEGYSLNYLYFPTKDKAEFVFYGQTPAKHPFRTPYGSWIRLNPDNGDILDSSDLREAPLLHKIVNAFEPIHFGDFGGFITKTLWFFAGLTPGCLYVSGFLMWWKRRKKT